MAIRLTKEQCGAVAEARKCFGRRWKTELKWCWDTTLYPGRLALVEEELQKLKDEIGYTGLYKLKR